MVTKLCDPHQHDETHDETHDVTMNYMQGDKSEERYACS